MENPILYVVLNKDLKMSAGKASSQAVHAAMMLPDGSGGRFTEAFRRTVIVLEATSVQIRNLQEYLAIADIAADYYIDEGVNEVAPYSITALAVEPIASDDAVKRAIFEPFKLFTGEGNKYEEALRFLERCSHDFRSYGMPIGDYTPRYMKKTLDWLRSRADVLQ